MVGWTYVFLADSVGTSFGFRARGRSWRGCDRWAFSWPRGEVYAKRVRVHTSGRGFDDLTELHVSV